MKKLMVPKKGVKVRDPETGHHLPETGAVKTVNTYFDRRVKDGDLDYQPVPKPQKKSKITKQKANGDE